MLDVTQNHHLIPLSLAVFKYLNFIAFGTRTLTMNKVHLKYAGMRLTDLEPNIEYILGLTI